MKTHESYSRRYRRRPTVLAYMLAGALIGAAGTALLFLLFVPSAHASPCRMACVAFDQEPLPEYRPDPGYTLPASYSPPKRVPFLACVSEGGAK